MAKQNKKEVIFKALNEAKAVIQGFNLPNDDEVFQSIEQALKALGYKAD